MTNRIKYFDIAKFIGMIMIILGHFGVQDINTFVYTFHIPMFFLISGYFFHPRNNQKNFILIKFKQLLYPYFFVMGTVILIYIIQAFLQGQGVYSILNKAFDYVIGYIYGSGYINKVFGYNIETVGPIWFCPALFWDFVILNKIIQLRNKELILSFLFIIGYISSQYFWLPFSIQASMTSVLLVYLGYLAKKNDIFNKRITPSTIIPLLCIWGVCISYGGRFLFVTNTAVNFLTDIISALAASYLVILYCMWLENNSRFADFMAKYGKFTLIMLCFHSIDITIMPWNNFYKTENLTSAIIIEKILLTFFKFIFPIVGTYIILKIKFLRDLFQIKD